MRVWMILGILILAGCEPVPPARSPGGADEGAMCGGLQGLACGAGAYCSYAPAARCGAADQTGICRPVPEVCTMEYAPVCGCNHETYANACQAAAAGVSVASQGACQ